MGNAPGVRSRTVVKADTPGVLVRADGNVCGPGVSTTGPPGVLSSLGIVIWTTDASAVGLRNVRDVNTLELFHPNRHLIGEESWKRFHINKFVGDQRIESRYLGQRRCLEWANLLSCKRLKLSVRITETAVTGIHNLHGEGRGGAPSQVGREPGG